MIPIPNDPNPNLDESKRGPFTFSLLNKKEDAKPTSTETNFTMKILNSIYFGAVEPGRRYILRMVMNRFSANNVKCTVPLSKLTNAVAFKI